MYLRISSRNIEEFSGSPKTAKMPHILTNLRLQRNWKDFERENHPVLQMCTDIATFFKIASDFFFNHLESSSFIADETN